ncbi:hypothetical protein RF11_02908 [Thelohanellus kitauei]|uniref:Uncharacterized protein n=1 Tax=Thelohanellus kitauei TaxID=669202 RepID=A0A0C2J0N6_THEKT|nr:hypothetical protein RF11_02908 [Thelohanellus kitauei]
MISFLVLLIYIPISLPGFSDAGSICYKVPSWYSYQFKMKYSDDVSFKPPKLSLEVYIVTIDKEFNVLRDVVWNYAITEDKKGCEDKMDVFQFAAGEQYRTVLEILTQFAFYKFYFGNFLVDQISIKSNEMDGEGDVLGLLARTSMRVKVGVKWNQWSRVSSTSKFEIEDLPSLKEGEAYRITFMNFDNSGVLFFVSLPNVSIKIPTYAIIEITLVDTEGTAVPNVVVVKDLVKIDIIQKSQQKEQCWFYIEESFHVLMLIIESQYSF